MLLYSVALCTYNGSKYVGEQLTSILGQTIKPSQIVISDDGSTDNTKEIVESILGPSMIDYIVVDNKPPHGVTSNFQNAIRLCTEPIIFTSDQDDVWLPKKAEKLLEVLEKNDRALLVVSNGELVDEDLNSLECSVWTSLGITDNIVNSGNLFHVLLRKCIVTGAAMAFRKELFDDVVSIPKEWLHDGWLAWLAVSKNGMVLCNEKLFYYRQHTDNVVGMIPYNSFYGHFQHYLENFNKMEMWREIRYKRYESLYNELSDCFSDTQKADILECTEFWKELYKMKDKSIVNRLKTIFRLYKQGLYHKYYTGKKGLIRDVVLAFR